MTDTDAIRAGPRLDRSPGIGKIHKRFAMRNDSDLKRRMYFEAFAEKDIATLLAEVDRLTAEIDAWESKFGGRTDFNENWVPTLTPAEQQDQEP